MEDASVTGGTYESVTHGDITIDSNHETAEQIKANLESEDDGKGKPKSEAEERKAAASKLGKAGGEASAKAREAKASEAEKEIEEEPEKGETKPAHPRDSARARVEQATRQLADERRRSQELERRLAALEAQRTAPVVTQDPPPKPGQTQSRFKDLPNLDDYAKYEEWNLDVTEKVSEQTAERAVERKFAEMLQRREAEAQAQAIVKSANDFNSRFSEAEKADPELFDKIDGRLLDIKPTWMLPPGAEQNQTNGLADVIFESEQGPQLLVYLTEHPEELSKILNMPSARAIERAVGRIEERLTAKPVEKEEKKAAPVSKAPAPIRPVSSSSQTKGDEEPDENASADEHIRYWNAKERQRRYGR